jgi:predicted DNA binding CopG/RHH family protein
MKSKKISRNKEDILTDEDFKSENVKIRISMFIPLSLQEAYKSEAAKLGIGYQTLMQMKLKEALDNSFERRLAEVEKKLKKHG